MRTGVLKKFIRKFVSKVRKYMRFCNVPNTNIS